MVNDSTLDDFDQKVALSDTSHTICEPDVDGATELFHLTLVSIFNAT